MTQLFASSTRAPVSLLAPRAPWAERSAGVRAAAALSFALLSAACEDIPSAVQLSNGTEIPRSDAPRRRDKLFVVGEQTVASLSVSDADDASVMDAATRTDAAVGGKPLDSGAADDDADADVTEPTMDVSRSCPVQISLQTVSYGSGDEAQEDYAPSNVGAIWITKRDGDEETFVRTVVAWGPTYFDQALTWISQTRGNLVDTVTLPTRPGHMRAVEASWDCRNTMQRLVAAGTYQVNFEFTEVESQGPVLSGERALPIALGDTPSEVTRPPQGYFGEIRVRAGQ